MNVCSNIHGNPSNNSGDTSVKTIYLNLMMVLYGTCQWIIKGIPITKRSIAWTALVIEESTLQYFHTVFRANHQLFDDD